MGSMKTVIAYTLLRLAFFFVPLAILLVLPIFQDFWYLTVVFAALIGLSLSLVFLRGPRERLSRGLDERRRPSAARRDAEAEDAALDDPRD